MVLDRKTNFFPRKKMVLGRKTNFFLGKRWFWAEKPIFPRKKMVLGRKTNFFLVKTKKTIFFGVWPHSFPKMFFLVFLFFLGKSWFFLPKTIFFLGKSWFSAENHLFPRENQKIIFLELAA